MALTDPFWEDDSDDAAILNFVLSKLSGVRKLGGYWMARCGAHDDHKASLSVARGTQQPVVLRCHAGCEVNAILSAAGLTMEDISRKRTREDTLWTPRGPAVAVYGYHDENGTLLYQVLRTATKEFPARIPDPLAPSGWRWKLGNTRRVLYRLPEVLTAIESGEPVWVVEGEKDADNLSKLGVIATCNPGGAGSWRPEYSQMLAGAAVAIIADADAPGRAHARAVAASLEGVAGAIDIHEPAVGKDVSDHLSAGKKLGELVTTRQGNDAEPNLVMELNRFLSVPDEPQRWVIKDILEHGDRLIFTGGEGLGKSTLTRQLAICAAVGLQPFEGYIGKHAKVLYIDCENSVRKSRRRFRPLAAAAMHMQRPVPDDGFMVCHMPRGIDLTKDEWAGFLLDQVKAHRPDLLVCGPLYKLHAVDANEETSARAIVSVLDAAIEIADCALITEAHMAKGNTSGLRRLEPAGSRLFLGWPDQGYGMKPEQNSRKRVILRSWRGDREERNWPRSLIWGRPGLDWPWVVPQDESPEDDSDWE